MYVPTHIDEYSVELIYYKKDILKKNYRIMFQDSQKLHYNLDSKNQKLSFDYLKFCIDRDMTLLYNPFPLPRNYGKGLNDSIFQLS